MSDADAQILQLSPISQLALRRILLHCEDGEFRNVIYRVSKHFRSHYRWVCARAALLSACRARNARLQREICAFGIDLIRVDATFLEALAHYGCNEQVLLQLTQQWRWCWPHHLQAALCSVMGMAARSGHLEFLRNHWSKCSDSVQADMLVKAATNGQTQAVVFILQIIVKPFVASTFAFWGETFHSALVSGAIRNRHFETARVLLCSHAPFLDVADFDYTVWAELSFSSSCKHPDRDALRQLCFEFLDPSTHENAFISDCMRHSSTCRQSNHADKGCEWAVQLVAAALQDARVLRTLPSQPIAVGHIYRYEKFTRADVAIVSMILQVVGNAWAGTWLPVVSLVLARRSFEETCAFLRLMVECDAMPVSSLCAAVFQHDDFGHRAFEWLVREVLVPSIRVRGEWHDKREMQSLLARAVNNYTAVWFALQFSTAEDLQFLQNMHRRALASSTVEICELIANKIFSIANNKNNL